MGLRFLLLIALAFASAGAQHYDENEPIPEEIRAAMSIDSLGEDSVRLIDVNAPVELGKPVGGFPRTPNASGRAADAGREANSPVGASAAQRNHPNAPSPPASPPTAPNAPKSPPNPPTIQQNTQNPSSPPNPQKEADKCLPKLDLVFLLDTSGSIERIYHEHVRWAVALVDSLPIEPDTVRVAAVQYAGFPLTEFALGTYPSADDIRQHLTQMVFQHGVTRTGYALRKAEAELFRLDRGARDDALKVIILFTDGHSVDDPLRPARQLRDLKGVRIFVVSLGANAVEKQMERIAGDAENVFGPSDLQKLRETLITEAEKARACARIGASLKPFKRQPIPKTAIIATAAAAAAPILRNVEKPIRPIPQSAQQFKEIIELSRAANAIAAARVTDRTPFTPKAASRRPFLAARVESLEQDVFEDAKSVDSAKVMAKEAAGAKTEASVAKEQKSETVAAAPTATTPLPSSPNPSPTVAETSKPTTASPATSKATTTSPTTPKPTTTPTIPTTATTTPPKPTTQKFTRFSPKIETPIPTTAESTTAAPISTSPRFTVHRRLHTPSTQPPTESPLSEFTTPFIPKWQRIAAIARGSSTLPTIPTTVVATTEPTASHRTPFPIKATTNRFRFGQIEIQTSANGNSVTCPHDILFIVDSSGSVQRAYDAQKVFLMDLLGRIKVANDTHRIALLQFAGSRIQKMEWSYEPYVDSPSMLRAIEHVRHITGTTFIGAALSSARAVLESRRKAVPSLVVLLSDGFSQDDALRAADHIKRLPNLEFYALSVNELSNLNYLKAIVGDEENVFGSTESEKLRDLVINRLHCRSR